MLRLSSDSWQEKYPHLVKHDPTMPIAFGRKSSWIAVKADHNRPVAEYFIDGSPVACDWVEGTVAAIEGKVYILPPTETGWVLVRYDNILVPNDPSQMFGTDRILDNASTVFGEVQLFASYSVSSSAVWLKSVSGKLVRAYMSHVDGGGALGEPTKVEEQWNLMDYDQSDIVHKAAYERHVIPGYEVVMTVAESWSVNPSRLADYTFVQKSGYYGKANETS